MSTGSLNLIVSGKVIIKDPGINILILQKLKVKGMQVNSESLQKSSSQVCGSS